MTAVVAVLLTTAACTGTSPDAADAGASTVAPGSGPSSSIEGTPLTGESDDPAPAPTVTGSSEGQSGGDSSEVAPATSPGPTHLGDRLPEVPAAARLTSVPEAATADDSLVASFPADVVLVPDGATVRSSSVTIDGDVVQTTLEARADAGCPDLLIAYRSWFAAGDFREESTTEVDGTAQLAFGRGDDVATLATAPRDEGCDVAVLATLTVGAPDSGE